MLRRSDSATFERIDASVHAVADDHVNGDIAEEESGQHEKTSMWNEAPGQEALEPHLAYSAHVLTKGLPSSKPVTYE